ncbi:MAG: hypothetical protein F4X58_13260 [Chloroflexi bacterium]|nr:hypothetical protein [Chloroflexota bacterium]
MLRVEPVAVLFGGLAAYWTLRALGRDAISFWSMAPAVSFPHVAAAWSHNRIEWQELLQLGVGLEDERSVYWDVTLFVVCLALLIALHRIIGIKRLNRKMLVQQVERPERGAVVRREATLVVGLLLAGLLATGAMIALAALLATNDVQLLSRTSLAIATIGGGAAVLLTVTLLLWFRGLTAARDEESVIIPDAIDESRQDAERS